MVASPIHADEERRLEALQSLGLFDTLPKAQFDRITRLACSAIKVPIAFVCLLDARRQWSLSEQGLDALEPTREISFCGHAILREEPLIVQDTREDSRFADDPLVIGPPFVRFYAGHPIHAPGGARVGALCVMDTRPRNLSSREFRALADLAALVDAEMLAIRFNVATRTVGVGVHERYTRNRDMWWSDAMWDIFGQDPGTFRASAENWLALIHPEDQDYVRESGGAWSKSRDSLNLQYRIIRPDGTIRHLQSISSRPEDSQSGFTSRISGITLDVTDRVSAERQEQALQRQLRESSHQAGMAEIAIGVLHSVGNVVNSLGISNTTVRRDLKALRLDQLEQATTLIHAHRASLASFLAHDARGQYLPDYLSALSAQISCIMQAAQAELDTSDNLLQQLRDIISAQQVHANAGGIQEPIDLKELIDTILLGQALELPPTIELVRNYDDLPLIMTDRHKLRFILVNILNNARDAVLASAAHSGRICLQLRCVGNEAIIVVEDSGVGMSAEVLAGLWRFGFTTKPTGQGFDLHNSANAAREIGATIVAYSDGPDKGSYFIIRLPIPHDAASANEG